MTENANTQKRARPLEFVPIETARHTFDGCTRRLSSAWIEGKRHTRIADQSLDFPGVCRSHEVELAVGRHHTNPGTDSLPVAAIGCEDDLVASTSRRQNSMGSIHRMFTFHDDMALLSRKYRFPYNFQI